MKELVTLTWDSSVHGLPGVLSVDGSPPYTAPMTTSLAWLSVPDDPDEKDDELLLLVPLTWSTALLVTMPDHSITTAAIVWNDPDPALKVIATEVWPPAQFWSVQISTLGGVVFRALAKFPADPPRVMPLTVGWVVLWNVPTQTTRQFPAVVPLGRVTVMLVPELADPDADWTSDALTGRHRRASQDRA
jgi:hypothetical protein